MFLKLSIFKQIALLCIYLMIFGVFSMKTIYYFSYQKFFWVIYFVLITSAFMYFVRYCYSARSNTIFSVFLFSMLFGYIPYEYELVRLLNLIVSPSGNLSGIAERMPLFFGVVFDIFFYPVLFFILLFFTSLVVSKE